MSLSSLPTALPSLSVREYVIDALYRCVIGLDTANKDLFDSSLTQDAVLDINGRVLNGLDAIHAGCYNILAKLDTTHFITNVRVSVKDGESTASLTASALAQHYRQGQGLESGAEGLLTGVLYYVDLVKDTDGLWKATNSKMRTTWFEGDRAIAMGK
ncbi:hypothetical protein V1525DRAFT_412084 [Lipomyces kononenkoae]|uniref:Uncharacterized protein n=1 Tax=Lipomyces kononenkoae TaxID=34357 RepID=A0ACC3STN0_LIPKO